jgi:hypothetical protein
VTLTRLIVLAFAGASCVPIPFPSTVQVERSATFEPARLNPPRHSDLLACVSDRLQEERADVRIVDAKPVWEALTVEPEGFLPIEAMLADEGACRQLAVEQVDYLITIQKEQSYRANMDAVIYDKQVDS